MKLVSILAALRAAEAEYEHLVLNEGAAEGLTVGEYAACLKDAYAGDYLVDWASGSSERKAVFEFEPQEDGCYVVEEWHPGMDSQCNRFSSMVRLDVDYCKGKSAYAYVDQAQNGGRWNILGALPFYVGWPSKVTVSSDQQKACREGSGCFWTADAVRVTKVSGLDVACKAPDTMPGAELNPAAAVARSDAEVLPEQQQSATIGLAVAPTLLDEASLTLASGWKTESLDESPLQCGRQGWGQRFAFLDPLEAKSDAPLEFEFEPEADGCYLVEEFHPADVCSKKLSPEVQMKLSYCKGKEATITVDQSTGGNRWNVLALLPYYKGWTGKLSVKHPQGGAGIATADAFRFTKIAGSCAAARSSLAQYAKLAEQSVSVTVDEADSEVQGQRLDSCDQTALMGAAHTVEGEGSAKFSFVPASTGCYRVDEYHPANEGKCQLSSADLTIDYCLGGRAEASLDLSGEGKQWNAVAHLPFYAGEPGMVTSKSAGGLWAADAFRFTKVSESCKSIPDASVMTVRLAGVDLKEPEFESGGHLTRHTDMRLAFQEVLAKYSGLAEEAVKLLGLRQGSIILDFEFSGEGAKAAAENLSTGFADGVLAKQLCDVATVGLDPAPECSAELLQVTHAASPTSSQAAQKQSSTGLIVGLSVAGGLLLLGAAGALTWRRRAKAAQAAQAAQAAEAAEASNVVVKSKDDDCDTASTGTPKVSSEVQTEVSGEISEVGSLASREATQELQAEAAAQPQPEAL